MHPPPGYIDLFPALSLGAVALIRLMDRIDPPPAIRFGIIALLALILLLYLLDKLHAWLPDPIGTAVAAGLIALAIGLLLLDRHQRKRSHRG